MPNNCFQFKQFRLEQEGAVFKVGTDAVLLGAWVSVAGARSILDIGTGTGLLALMLAQRTKARITAIDIDRYSCELARRNVEVSPWRDRIEIVNSSIQDFKARRPYDLIICNPPFFQDSMLPVDKSLVRSKHNTDLTFAELAVHTTRLLSEEGKFCVVFPVNESKVFGSIACEVGLLPCRILELVPKPGQPPKRKITEFNKNASGVTQIQSLVIEKGGRHQYSEDYKNLTRDFYLNF